MAKKRKSSMSFASSGIGCKRKPSKTKLKSRSQKKKKTSKKKVKPQKRIATRTIRGEKRKVEITRKKNGKESVRVLHKKKIGKLSLYKNYPLTQKAAKIFQKSRPKAARNKDAKTTSKNLVKDKRWTSNPGKFDYPGIDTKGKGGITEKQFQKQKQKIKNQDTKFRVQLEKEVKADKKSKAKYDKEMREFAKIRQKKRDKKYAPKLKESINKMNKFKGSRDGLTKLFNREYSKVGTQRNRDKLANSWDRNERRLKVKNEKKKLKEMIKKEKNPIVLRRLKEHRKIARRTGKKYIKGKI